MLIVKKILNGNTIMYLDSHSHFDLTIETSDKNEDDLLQSLNENSITHAVQISTETEGLQWSYDFAKRNRDKGILFSAGIHPSSPAESERLRELADFTNSVMNSADKDLLFGIGECGLDYYRMHQEKDMQHASFEHQIDLAKRCELPLIIHSRDAMDDTLAILKSKEASFGIMHCFSGNSKTAEKVLDLGFYISFAGNVTYKNATDLHDAIKYVPSDRLLLETDAPFLTPVPYRGKKNMPHYIIHTYNFAAEARKQSINGGECGEDPGDQHDAGLVQEYY